MEYENYLFVVKLALERYSLETDDFYKLNRWKQMFQYPHIIRSAYVALDLWRSEQFIGLDDTLHIEATRIFIALLNA